MAAGTHDTHEGALPCQTIRTYIAQGHIRSAHEKNVQPASLDLSISDEVYRLPGVVQPLVRESVRSLIERFKGVRCSLDATFERNTVYIARLNESLALPDGVYGLMNPKSTTGRLDVHVRVMADGTPRFDTVEEGFDGELWIMIVPRSFPLAVEAGTPFAQLRLFRGHPRLDEAALEDAFDVEGLLWRDTGDQILYEDMPFSDHDGSIILTLDTYSEPMGWVATNVNTPINPAVVGGYDAAKFFQPVVPDGGYVYLRRDHFYILSTRELIRVPPTLACEMVPMDERSGEFRAHYAGFIDPGWGWGEHGEEKGRPLTLEVRPHEDIIIGPRQPIGKIAFERMQNKPDTVYDLAGSNYRSQSGPKLAKQFTQ